VQAVNRGAIGIERLVPVAAGAATGFTAGRGAAVRAPARAGRLLALALAALLCGYALTAALGASTHSAGTAPVAARLAPAAESLASISPRLSEPAGTQSIAAAERTFWATQSSAGTLTLRNPLDGVSATLANGAAIVRSRRGVRLGLGRTQLSRAGMQPITPRFQAGVAERNSVSFAASGMREWFSNRAHGLEQGFVLTHRAPGRAPLVISQQADANAGGLTVAHGDGVSFRSPAGSLLYTHLRVSDAAGRRVPARMSISGDRLRITIRDAHAAYPLRVDPVILAPVTQTPASNAATGPNPYSVAFSPTGNLLAVTNYNTATLSIFTVDQSTGSLTPVVQDQPSNTITGGEPDAVAFSPDGSWLATSNAYSGNISIFSVQESSGQLAPVMQSQPSNASTGSDPYGVAFSPDGTLVAVANLGSNSVSIFSFDDESGQLTPVTQSPTSRAKTGAEPAWVAFSPNGALLAVANIAGNSVSVFSVDDASGALTPVAQSPASNAATGQAPGSVSFSPDGSLLATANFGSNDVSVFSVDDASGALTPIAQSPASNAATGNGPVWAAFSPKGGLLATADWGSNGVSLFSVDAGGDLTPLVQSSDPSAATGQGPAWVAFSPSGNLLATANSAANDVSIFTVKETSTTQSAAANPTIAYGHSETDTLTVTGTATSGPPSGDGSDLTFHVCGPTQGSCNSGGTVVASAGGLAAAGTDTASATSASFTPPAVGTYCFYASYAGDPGYVGSADTTPSCFDVTPAPLQASVGGSQTYGGLPSFEVTGFSGFVNGDSAAIVAGSLYGCTTRVSVAAGVGSYAATIGGCAGLSAPNYAITYSDAGFNVTAAPLTITASSPTMPHGGPVPTITPGYSGFVNGDTAGSLPTPPSCSTSATVTSPIGSSPATSCSGAADPDYQIGYVAGAVTVVAPTLQTTAGTWLIISHHYRHARVRFVLQLPGAGGLTFTATHAKPSRGSRNGTTHAVVVVGHRHASARSGRVRIKLALNKRGRAMARRALAHHRRLSFRVKVTYAPAGGKKQSRWVRVLVSAGHHKKS
jgi:6-phosphogluconolactonase (cycloisomerase 2 family)